MKFNIKKDWMYILIVAILLIVFVVYADSAGYLDDLKESWGTSPGNGNGGSHVNDGSGSGASSETEAEDDDFDDDGDGGGGGGGSWHTQTASGDFSVGAGEQGQECFDFPDAPDDTFIDVTFYHSWTDDGCSPCEPGLVWCVHDSRGAQIYHSVEASPTSGTDTITGWWEPCISNWCVWIGNNCPCTVHVEYQLTARWFE